MKSEMIRKKGESGSAFVISILILFVLSVLGMALMLTTTTETDISVNYRWGEMAFFNADAALEYGKNVLAAYAVRDSDLRFALPPVREDIVVAANASWGAALPETPPCGSPENPGCRDYQYFIDSGPDPSGQYMRTYIGKVLRDLGNNPIQYDFRQPVVGDARGDINNDGSADIEGTVTIWIRRPIAGGHDYREHDRAILTAEGTAPNYEYAAGTDRAGSLRRLEMTVSLNANSGVAGHGYTDVTQGSRPNANVQAGWRTVDVIQ